MLTIEICIGGIKAQACVLFETKAAQSGSDSSHQFAKATIGVYS